MESASKGSGTGVNYPKRRWLGLPGVSELLAAARLCIGFSYHSCSAPRKGNTPDNLKTNWLKGGKMIITRMYPDPKTGKFDL